MKTEKKHSLLVWTIVLLVVVNLSTLITIVYQQRKSSRSESVAVSGQVKADPNGDKFSGRYFRDQLNWDNEQMEKFRIINPLFRPKLREITTELAQKREQMLLEMSAAKSDTVLLNTLSDSIGFLHSDLKKITYRYYLELKGICSPEQQIKLEQLFGEVFPNDGSVSTPGMGGQNRRQYGRQFKN